MKVDLHLHSEYSWDSTVPITEYIELAEKNGFGGISITDHNNTQSHGVIQKLQKSTEVILIPGQEINTLDGHLLIYGWLPTIDRDLSMEETINNARKHAGEEKIYCIAAHPFDRLRGGKGSKVFSTGIDGLEVINASALLSIFNNRAQKQSAGLDTIKVGNSDAHRVNEFGSAWTEISEVNSIASIMSSLISGSACGSRIGLRNKSSRFIRRKFKRKSKR